MSEKRFSDVEFDNGMVGFHIDKDFKEYPKVVDSETDCFYHFDDSLRNVEIFCERLNELSTDNRQLNDENEQLRNCRKQQIEQANTIHKLLKENGQLRNAIEDFLDKADMFSEEATVCDIYAYAYDLACAIAELKKVINV